MIGARGRMRRDFPAVLAIVIIILLMVASLQARAADPVADAVRAAVKEAGADSLPGWIQLAGNLTVAGILWFYSRQFYTAMERKDKELLEVTKELVRVATNSNHLAENYERLVRDLVPDARTGSGRIASGHGNV